MWEVMQREGCKVSVLSLYIIVCNLLHLCIYIVAQLVKNLPAVQGTRVQSLGWEDSLEKEMATHSSILAWKISWTEEPGGLQSTGSQRVGHNWATNTHTYIFILFFKYLLKHSWCVIVWYFQIYSKVTQLYIQINFYYIYMYVYIMCIIYSLYIIILYITYNYIIFILYI